jgi:N-acetylmuramoyl-L-alanine amidase
MRIETQYSSSNHSDRGGHAVRLLVLHATAGSLQSSLSWLCNPSSRVSTHYLISKTGRVLRLVSEDRAAWHAGRADWHGEKDVNAISIGIELENTNSGRDPYPQAQIDALTALVLDIKTRYPRIEITRHMDVARPVGRKTDPAGFPFEQWRSGFRVEAPTMPPPVSPPPTPKRYRARRILISTRPEGGLPYAGELQPGEEVVIDKWYPSSHTGHLQDERGFVLMDDLEAL